MKKLMHIIPFFLLITGTLSAQEDSSFTHEEYSLERILELVKDCSDDIAVADLAYAAGLE